MTNASFLTRRLDYDFPLTTTHHGIPLSNGTFGALIRGDGADIRITINRQDYWDHRGGIGWNDVATWENLKQWLTDDDEQSLRAAFENTGRDENTPPRPTRLPMGRIDLKLSDGFTIATGGLDMARGEAQVEFAPGGVVRGVILRDHPVLALSIRGTEAQLKPTPVYHEEVLEHFRKYGFPPAQEFADGNFSGWVQECPGEPAMCVGCLQVVGRGRVDVWVSSVFGDTPQAAMDAARALLEEVSAIGYDQAADQAATWWRAYWEQSATVTLPDPDRELLYYLGMYKLAGLSWPGGPAATLQGPWVEEYTMPPWSSDYHFNINVQECYWPAYGGNQLQAFDPLVQMLKSWEPLLRRNARSFVGVQDGLMLPHAVDDRCTCMGGFWTGSIDHGSTAWTGQLLWQVYRHSMDADFLRETAYPFMKGAMRVYEAMLDDDGSQYSLPVSVSPEFGGAGKDAWGKNASFQLANIHFLCEKLTASSELLGLDADDRRKWQDIHARLPLATARDGQIWLWEGQPLSESHRHHSHLAGLYPFDIYDLNASPEGPHAEQPHRSASGPAVSAPEQRALVMASIGKLTDMGMGRWTGWCMPWASILFGRIGNGEMADLILGLYRRVFMNHGYASTHDAQFPGFTVMAGRPQIMQIEACLAASAAVMEMLVHVSRGVMSIFPAVPARWKDASFEGIRTEGAFLVSAWREDGLTKKIGIMSEAGAELVLRNPFAGSVRLRRDGGQPETLTGDVLRLTTHAGEVLVLKPA